MAGYFIAGAVLFAAIAIWTIARPANITATLDPVARVVSVLLNLGLGFLFLYAAVHL